jgi:tRNA A37 N6-isopentenylltransferase MiaA
VAKKYITSISEVIKSRSTERSVSFPKLQKVVPKGAQCKFSAQKSFQRECRAKYRRNIRQSAKRQREYRRNRRRRSSKDVPKGMQNLQRKVSADTPKNKRWSQKINGKEIVYSNMGM